MCTNVAQLHVVCRHLLCAACVLLLLSERESTVAYDERVYLQVNRFTVLLLLLLQRVGYKLEVELPFPDVFIHVCLHSEELNGGDAYFALCKLVKADLDRQTRCLEQVLTPLVWHVHIVNDESVEEAKIYASHAHLCSNLFTQSLAHICSQRALHHGHMEHRYNHKIGSQEASYGYIYYVFKVFYRLQFYQFYNPFFVSLAKLAHFFIIAKQKDDFLLLTFDFFS